MAVASLLTSLENFEASPVYENYGTGGGASDNTDVFIEGAQSGGRRVDNATDKGFGATLSPSVDLSAAGEHIKLWVYCFHWTSVTQLQIRINDGTNDDDHEYPAADIPNLGGWIPVWLDVSRTPEIGGSCDESAVTGIGALIDIGNVGGAGDNFIVDEIVNGTSGYKWTGAGGDFGDFRTYEETNVEGVFIDKDGVDFLYARLEIGDASTSAVFTDSGFNVVCPDQALVSSTFMGITCDLTQGATNIDLTNGSFASGDPASATNRPDLLVTGTSGAFDADTLVLNGLRTIELTSACTFTNSVILNTGLVDATNAGSTGADLSGTSVIDSTVAVDASAVEWDVNEDPDTKTDGMSFVKGTNAHHAIEFGLNSPLTMTVRGWTTSGFNAANGNNDSTFHVKRTSGSVTINVIGGTGNFSYKTDGATVTVVISPVTTLVNAKDENRVNLQNARVYLKASSGSGPMPYQDSVTITRAGTVATVTHTSHAMETGDKVVIKGITDKTEDNNGTHSITVTGASTYTYVTTDSGSTSYTGSIISTWVAIEALTDPSGNASRVKSYGSNQPVNGQVRMSTSSPFYRTFPIAGTIDSADGLTINVQMVLDE